MGSSFQPLEPRRLLSAFAALDASFNKGELLPLGYGLSQVVPLADGRIMTVADGKVEYRRGDGNIDPKRGSTLTRDRHFEIIQIDPASGRFATLRLGSDANYVVELFDVKGRRSATATLPGSAGLRRPSQASLALSPDGGVAVVLGTVTGDSNVFTRLSRVYRLDARLQPVDGFGDQGVVTFSDVFQDTDQFSHPRSPDSIQVGLALVGVDDGGRVYVTRDRIATQVPGRVYVTEIELARLTADGAWDTGYGGSTPWRGVTHSYNNIVDYSHDTSVIDEMALSSDGAAYFLVRHSANGEQRIDEMRVLRFGPDGPDDVAEKTLERGVTADMAVGHDGQIYVAAREYKSAAFLFKLDGKTLENVIGWSDSGPYVVTTSDTGHQLAVGPASSNNRLYMWGRRTNLMKKYDSASVVTALLPRLDPFVDVSDGSTRLTSDGTLVVKGTRGNDHVVFSFRDDRILILNAGKTAQYKMKGVRGIVVSTGDGNDRVEVVGELRGPGGFAFHVDGGRGHDSLTSAAGWASSLVGGDGNDTLIGAGDDFLFGQNGDDTLQSNGDRKNVFGGRGTNVIL